VVGELTKRLISLSRGREGDKNRRSLEAHIGLEFASPVGGGRSLGELGKKKKGM